MLFRSDKQQVKSQAFVYNGKRGDSYLYLYMLLLQLHTCRNVILMPAETLILRRIKEGFQLHSPIGEQFSLSSILPFSNCR